MRFLAFAGILAIGLVTSASAGVINVTCSNDSDNAITWRTNVDPEGWEWEAEDNDLYLWESLHSSPAHVIADFEVDGDPVVNLWKDVENDTASPWSFYRINIIRSNSAQFNVQNAIGPATWGTPTFTATSVFHANYIVDGVNVGPAEVATIDYPLGGGNAIPVGNSGLFYARLEFFGNANFIVEQLPNFPEPMSVVLMIISSVLLAPRRRRTA